MTSQTSALTGIFDLQDAPQYAQEVVRQNFDQWGAFTNLTLRGMAELFHTEHERGTLPITFIAVEAGRYAGCVSLRAVTMGAITHPEAYLDETPWLSNMWVAEFARGRGLASKLTQAVHNAARRLGYQTVYSSTQQPDSLYHKLGYIDIEARPYRGCLLYLIKKDLK